MDGKKKYGVNEILPLEGICLLERDKTNHIEEITMKGCLPVLMNQCHIPDGGHSIQKVLNLINQLSSLKLYRLSCNMDDEAAFVSFNAMVKEENILGFLTLVKRKGKTINVSDFEYKLYTYLLCAPYPLRFFILKYKKLPRRIVGKILRKLHLR